MVDDLVGRGRGLNRGDPAAPATIAVAIATTIPETAAIAGPAIADIARVRNPITLASATSRTAGTITTTVASAAASAPATVAILALGGRMH